MDKEFTVDEISCAYCVYHNPVLEDYMHELGYDEDESPEEGIAAFSCGVDTLKELRELLGEEGTEKLLGDSIFDDDYRKVLVSPGNYNIEY